MRGAILCALVASAAFAQQPADKLPERLVARLGFEKFRCDTAPIDVSFPGESGRPLTVSMDGSMREWDPVSGEVTWEGSRFSPGDRLHAISADGKWAAWRGEKGVSIAGLRESKEERALDGLAAAPQYLAFSLDGRRLAAASKSGLAVWDSESGALVGSAAWEDQEPSALAFGVDQDSVVVAIAESGFERFPVALDSKGSKIELKLKPGPVFAITASLAVIHAGDPDGLHIYELATGRETVIEAAAPAPNLAALSRDGSLVAASFPGGIIRVWSVKSGRQVVESRTLAASMQSMAFSPDGKRIAALPFGGFAVYVVDVATGRSSPEPVEETYPINRLAASPDGRLLAAYSRVECISVWDVRARRPLWRVRALGGPIVDLAFWPDGSRVLATFLGQWGSPSCLQVLDAKTGRELRGVTDEHGPAAFSPDGAKWARGIKEGFGICDAASLEGRTLVSSPYARHDGIAFSRDGRSLFVVGSRNDHQEGDVQTALDWVLHELSAVPGAPEHLPLPLPRFVAATRFSPDACLLAVRRRNTTRVLDTRTGAPVFEVSEPVKWLQVSPEGMGVMDMDMTGRVPLAWSSDGRFLASTSRPGRIGIIDIASGRKLFTLTAPTECLVWIPGATEVACVGEEPGRIYLFDATPPPIPATAAEDPLLGHAWTELGDRRGSAACRAAAAISSLGRKSESFLESHLNAAESPAAEVDALAKKLADENAAERDAAHKTLASLGTGAEAGLRRALSSATDPEVRARLEALLSPLSEPRARNARDRRNDWSIRILENMGSQDVLARISGGAYPSRVRAAAAASLERLKGRR